MPPCKCTRPRIEQFPPRIGPVEQNIAKEHCRASAERESVACKAGRRVLILGDLADERQAVVGFQHLARPTIRHDGGREDHVQTLDERAIGLRGVGTLARLMVFAPEDGRLEIAAVFDA